MYDRYLFRAKRTDNRELVEGALFDGKEHCIIGQKIKFSPYVSLECKITGYEVDPSTICQCTGLTDKNGKKIFEGDILRHADETILKTVWNDRKYGFAAQCVKGSVLLKDCKWGLWEFESDEVEVIGNVFDNPELLGGTK